ncbi:MAG: response regulator transcription factor [Candidatus Planktophila sp.]|nr:response regulator transcription factor [Candidatus Planktophila sp.]
MTRVVIIDDHVIVREGLKRALENHNHVVVAEAATLTEARAQIAHTNPDVIVVDLNLPDGSGFDLITWARGISKSLGIVVLTLNDTDAHVIAAMSAGASAYILKSNPLLELLAAIDHSVISPLSFTAHGLSVALANKERKFGLTSREFDVLALLPSGASTKEIAANLFLSSATIKSHLASIFRKLEVTNRTAAVGKARKHNLVSE